MILMLSYSHTNSLQRDLKMLRYCIYSDKYPCGVTNHKAYTVTLEDKNLELTNFFFFFFVGNVSRGISLRGST